MVRCFPGCTAGLVPGKPIGILALSWLSARMGITDLPRGTHWAHVGVVGLVGGIGFTMSLFIARLAFPSGALLETAEFAVLWGSGLAVMLSILVGHRILTPGEDSGIAATEAVREDGKR